MELPDEVMRRRTPRRLPLSLTSIGVGQSLPRFTINGEGGRPTPALVRVWLERTVWILIGACLALFITRWHGNNKASSPLNSGTVVTQTSELAVGTGHRGDPPYISTYTGPTTVWSKKNFPCFPSEKDWHQPEIQSTPIQQGFVLTKTYKSASSTLKGIAIQIALNVAQRSRNGSQTTISASTDPCLVRYTHAYPSARTSHYAQLIKGESFLWTFLREPTERAVSHFFFREVSRGKIEPNDANFQCYLKKRKNYYIQEMSFEDMGPYVKDTDSAPGRMSLQGCEYQQSKTYHNNLNDIISDILGTYDFIGLVERLHESLVVLKLLLGLEYVDILYLPTKVTGSYDDGFRDHCIYIQPKFISPGMEAWLNSGEWLEQTSWDNALYAAAHTSLDLTIERLGKNIVAEQVVEYERQLKIAKETCLSSTKFPCSADGVRTPPTETTCLDGDAGCGYECFSNIAFS